MTNGSSFEQTSWLVNKPSCNASSDRDKIETSQAEPNRGDNELNELTSHDYFVQS
jgi:hypothetical protein